MTHVPHEILEEFPELKDKIHDMKLSNGHFSRLYEDYHRINREVHRIEAAGLNTSDEEFEKLKHDRLRLKDEIYRMLHG